MRTTRRSVRAAATGLWLRWWEWPTTAALAVLAFRLGFGSFRRLSVMLGGGDKGAAGALVLAPAEKALRHAVETAYPRSRPDYADRFAMHECKIVDGVTHAKF